MTDSAAAVAASPKRSFASLFTPAAPLQSKPVQRYKGSPMITFSEEEINSLAAPFRYTLVCTFWYGRPPLATIRSAIDRIGFVGAVKVGLLDPTHIVLHFDQELDYIRCFSRRGWIISGKQMRITKWTPNYDPTKEVPVVPIWVIFPGLPLHMHRKDSLFQIAAMLGTPLKLDAATASMNRPSLARVCVELDVSKELPQRIFIQTPSRVIMQNVEYEDLPKYCSSCYKLGHVISECGTENPTQPPLQESAPTEIMRSKKSTNT